MTMLADARSRAYDRAYAYAWSCQVSRNSEAKAETAAEFAERYSLTPALDLPTCWVAHVRARREHR